MREKLRRVTALLVLCGATVLLTASAHAQSVYGSIFGSVTDRSGAAIPGATITVTDVAKGTVVTVLSNASGDYSVAHLIPDTYDLRVTATGFKSFEAKGIQVLADAAPRIDPTLEVGGAAETVQVTADQQPILKTDRADVATIFDEQQVSSLPVADQNFTALQLLLPGAQMLGWSHAATEDPQGSRQINVNGQAFGGTAFELDGTDNQDPILGIIVINPAMDAVTETKITTQNFDAELGKAVSAVVTAQTRSGTNSYHGSAYDFRVGNANLAHNPYNTAPIPAGLKNRYGGSVGGRIIRDKAFFFGNYEAIRSKVGTSAGDTVPTTHLLNSCLGTEAPFAAGAPAGCDFSEYASILGQNIFDNSPAGGGAQFANNVIPAGRLSAPAVAILKLMQPYKPNNGATLSSGQSFIANNYSASGAGLFNADSWTVRGDYTFNQKAHAFGRFSRFTDTLSGKPMFGAAGGGGFGTGGLAGSSKGANDSLASGMDIAVNPNLLTDWRFGYYRYSIITAKFDQGEDFATQIGIPGINTGSYFTSGAPGWFIPVGVTGGTTYGTSHIGAGLNIGRCNCPLTEKENQYQGVNNWTKIMGSHTLKFGVDLRFAHNLRVPSDSDRAGEFDIDNKQTSSNGSGGLSWASFMLGQANQFQRYVSVSTNARENQHRFYFYGQDTWRVTQALTINYGLRWEYYSPEFMNAKGNGALLNLDDGYMHVAGIGQVPLDMGWTTEKTKTLAPRLGITYQMDPKTVLRAGYGRSFDLGVFGSLFGHVVTQNLPILAAQHVTAPSTTAPAVTFDAGPPAATLPTVPSNGLLPAQGYAVSPKARPNPLHFPTIDAWNLSVQRALTPSTALTVAYVANKGTHTLGDGNNNNTDPNEGALALPGQYSVTGQTLTWDPNGPAGGSTALPSGYSGGVSQGKYLKRYYGGSLAGCRDSNYISLTGLQAANGGDVNLQSGMCGWNNSISYYGTGQNTEFEALQITLAQQMKRGLAFTANYQWASAFGESSQYFTWNKAVTHMRDSNVRTQQITAYGSYDLPFGKGKQFLNSANHATELLLGGFQIAATFNAANGLPWTPGYGDFSNNKTMDCNHNVGQTNAPCRPNANGHMKTSLTKFDPVSHRRTFFTAQPASGGIFSFPGLNVIGNAGGNTYRGPGLWTADANLSKTFAIWESVAIKFRMDAFNVFNHITAGNPSNNVLSDGVITNMAQGCDQPGASCGPRQLDFGLRLQF